VVTVLHELVHQTFFAPGEVAFNETLATAVAWRLAERYYRERGDEDRVAKVVAAREAWLARSDVLDAAAARLEAFFDDARRQRLAHERMLEQRAMLYATVRTEIDQADPAFASALGGELDNASFLASYRYATGGRAIDAFLDSCPGIPAAFARLDAAVAHKEDLRRAIAGDCVAPPAS
jgi:predicted aminopeptidase